MSAPTLPAGHIVAGRYTIRAPLGERAWASTYSAITSPNREVVLKVAPAEIAARPAAIEAVRRASRVTEVLGARFVVPLLDSGRDATTHASYLVTELSPHPSLAELVQICPLAADEVAAMVSHLTDVLDRAHAVGVAHLALKPSNVFVGPAPEISVRVADFGAGALRGGVDPEARRALVAPWLAPEQAARWDEEDAGLAADVYTTALIAFFALTGHSYWQPAEAASTDPSRWGSAIYDLRTPASVRAAAFGITVAPELDAVMARALAPDPSARFDTIAEAGDALARALSPSTSRRMEPKAPAPPMAVPLRAPEPLISAPAVAISIPQIVAAAPAHPLPSIPSPAPAPVDPIATSTPPMPMSEAVVDASFVSALAPPVAEAQGAIDGLTEATPRRRLLIGAGAAAALAVALGLFVALRGSAPRVDGAAASTRAVEAEPSPAAVAPAAGGSPTERSPVDGPADAPRPRAEPGELRVVCVPDCERVLLNGQPMESFPEPASLPPGTYGVGVGRTGYGGQFRQIVLRPGEKETVSFTLSHVHPPAKKPCGKFLKRCE